MGMFDIEILYMETCIGRDPIRIYFVKIEIFNWEVIKRPSFPSNQLSHLMNEVSTQPQFSFTSILCGYELNQPQNWSEHCFILPESTIKGTACLSVDKSLNRASWKEDCKVSKENPNTVEFSQRRTRSVALVRYLVHVFTGKRSRIAWSDDRVSLVDWYDLCTGRPLYVFVV